MTGLWGQYEVVSALILRETRTRFGDYKAGYLWAVIQPMLTIALFMGMFFLAGRKAPPYGMNAIAFLATGFLPFGMFASTFTQGSSAFTANRTLMWYPQVRLLDCVTARSLLEFYTGVLAFSVVIGIDAVVFGAKPFGDLLVLLGGLVLTWWMGAAGGLLISGLTTYVRTLNHFTGTLSRPFFWTSGLFFTVNSLPSSMREPLLYNPLLHTIDKIRDGCFDGYHAVYTNWWYPLSCCVVLTFLGLSVERLARQRLHLL